MRIKIVFLLLVVGFLADAAPLRAQDDGQTPLQPPETIEEARGLGLQFLGEIPEAMQGVWETQALPVFSGVWSWARGLWDSTVFSLLEDLWDKILSFFGREIEERKPGIEERFQTEKQQLQHEVQESLPQEGRTLWQLIKGFFDKNGQE